MKKEVTAELLRENGFTQKEIAILNAILSEHQSETYESLLVDLRKRFLGGCVMIFVIIAFMTPSTLHEDFTGVLINLGVFLFAFFAIYYIFPLKLAWKAWRCIKKIN